MRVAALALAAVLLAPAAARADGFKPSLGGDVKGFFVAVFPYDSPLLPKDPLGESFLDLRLKLAGRLGSHVKYTVHPVLSITTQSHTTSLGLGPAFGAGTAGLGQLVDLSWHPVGAPGFTIDGRIDRLMVAFSSPGLQLTIGRQPVSFGTTFFFNPEDLVAPFTPVTLDREYKPGIDAVRVDGYFGTSGQITAVVAYAGAPGPKAIDPKDLVIAARSGFTVGVFDIGLFTAAVHDDMVLGLDTAGSIGAFGVRGEATLTYPAGGGSPFVRAVVGADRKLDMGLTLSGELYLQTLGALEPSGYLAIATSARAARGEIWAFGRYYAALSADYEVSAIVHVSAFAVANLHDPSALCGLGLTWSVGDNTEIDAGAYVGAGARPDGLDLKSEFGLVPTAGYAIMKSYF